MNKQGALIVVTLCLLLMPLYSAGTTILFDFDSGTPTPQLYQPLPIDITVNGLMAHFDGRFSVQSNATTFFMLQPPFSGNYLSPSDVYSPTLDITFSQPLTSIQVDLATVDMGAFETGSPVKLTAYVDSTAGTMIGSATAAAPHGDGFAQSTLVFSSATPFNFVHIALVPGWASDFLADNVQVTTANSVPEPASALLVIFGLGAIIKRTRLGLNRYSD